MKLPELINFLINPKSLPQLYLETGINNESEAILIYLKEKINIESEVFLFEIEKTEDEIVFKKDGIIFIQLFPIDLAIELIESDLQLKGKGYSNLEIANRLLDYRLKDA